MSEKMPCSAREYAWLKSELTKARRDLQRVLLTGAEGNEVQKEISQTYMTLIMFYEKALNSFFVGPGRKRKGYTILSRKFMSDLKSLDDAGLIDAGIARQGRE